MPDDRTAAGLVGLLFTAIDILSPLAGAVVAALAIRRRGRNARLAMIGRLVMLPGPIVFTLGMGLGLDPLMNAVGPLMATHVLTAIPIPFHLIGFAVILAGALSVPRPTDLPLRS